jgi:hypothetical protein
VRSSTPGFTLVGKAGSLNLGTGTDGWEGSVWDNVTFPMGVPDDVFLHVSSLVSRALVSSWLTT